MLISGSSELLSNPGIAISGNAYIGNLLHSNTASRNYTLPDKSGTIAMLSDVPQTYPQTFGDGSTLSYPITHNLGVSDYSVNIWETGGSKRQVTSGVEIQKTSNNVCTLVFSTAPALNSLRCEVFSGGGFNFTLAPQIITYTSSSLSVGAQEIDTVNSGCYNLIMQTITASSACRLRIYGTHAAAVADQGRAVTINPIGNTGLFAEFLFVPGLLTLICAPIITCFNNDTVVNTNLYFTIQNTGTTTTPITLTASVIRIQ